MKRKRNSLFGREATERAQSVRQLTDAELFAPGMPVRERETGERGEVLGHVKDWIKVKWRNRSKPTLIRASELAAGNPARRKRNALFSEMDSLFCADCDKALKGKGVKRPDGRMVCATCAKQIKRSAEDKKQRSLFVEARTLFNPSHLSPTSTHQIRVKGYCVPEHYRKGEKGAKRPQAVVKKKATTKARAKRAAKPSRVRLATFVRGKGGFRDDGQFAGELRYLGAKEGRTTGLVTKRGLYPDRMREIANEAGYRESDGTQFRNVGDFIAAVQSDLQGYEKFLPLSAYEYNPMKRAKKVGTKKRAGAKKAAATKKPVKKAAVKAKRATKRKNPGIVTAIVGGMASGAGYAVGSKWMDDRLRKKNPTGRKKKAAAKPDAARAFARQVAKEMSGYFKSVSGAAYGDRKKPVGVRNPAPKRLAIHPEVASMHREFLGRKHDRRTPGHGSALTPAQVAQLGKLHGLKVNGTTYRDFPASARLVADKDGNLHVTGARWQRGADGSLSITGAAPRKGELRIANPNQLTKVGPLEVVEYNARKSHLHGGGEFIFHHTMGEDDGRRPTLCLDPEGYMIVRGGSYTVQDVGIVN